MEATIPRLPQESVLAPVLYLMHIRDIPKDENTSTFSFTEDPDIMAAAETVRN